MLVDNYLEPYTGLSELVYNNNPNFNPYRYYNRGGDSIGIVGYGRDTVLWSLEYNPGQRLFSLSSESGISYSLGNPPADREVTQVNFVFDEDLTVMWSYSYIDTNTNKSHVRLSRYTKLGNVLIGDYIDVTSPVLMRDTRQNIGLTQYAASTLLMYATVVGNVICVRHSDDNYETEKSLNQIPNGEFLVSSGLTTDRRARVSTRRQAGYTTYDALLCHDGTLLLDADGNPFWVAHPTRNTNP